MDRARKRLIKKLGKAEVARRSEELQAALSMANPAALGSDQWMLNHSLVTVRERWLRRSLPLLHTKQLHSMFIVSPYNNEGWVPHLGGYVMCTKCGSVAPSAIPWRLLYWKNCACGNIGWRCFFGRTRFILRDPESVVPVLLMGRGEDS